MSEQGRGETPAFSGETNPTCSLCLVWMWTSLPVATRGCCLVPRKAAAAVLVALKFCRSGLPKQRLLFTETHTKETSVCSWGPPHLGVASGSVLCVCESVVLLWLSSALVLTLSLESSRGHTGADAKCPVCLGTYLHPWCSLATVPLLQLQYCISLFGLILCRDCVQSSREGCHSLRQFFVPSTCPGKVACS